MFNLAICGHDQLFKTVQDFKPTHTISLIDPIDIVGGKHLYVKVDDVQKPTLDYIHPQRYHLDTIFEFTKDLCDSDRLLVHCFSGQSRSTAIAIGVLLQHGMDYRHAFDKVWQLRPIVLPNRMFITLLDDYFNLNGELNTHIQNYRFGCFEQIIQLDRPSQDEIDRMQIILNMLTKK